MGDPGGFRGIFIASEYPARLPSTRDSIAAPLEPRNSIMASQRQALPPPLPIPLPTRYSVGLRPSPPPSAIHPAIVADRPHIAQQQSGRRAPRPTADPLPGSPQQPSSSPESPNPRMAETAASPGAAALENLLSHPPIMSYQPLILRHLSILAYFPSLSTPG
ncbi:hypothetical protein IMZ48_15185 [Candidatus Bathyarchaeota archaeon]|nr:hypothetical protein [Candidatus Bathyarchaeota archaeon]